MKESLLQGKLSNAEFIFGVLLAVTGGVIRAINSNASIRDLAKSGAMGIFVAIVSGLVFIEYFKSPTVIVASMGLSGYSGASFLDSINAIGKVMAAFKTALNEPELIIKENLSKDKRNGRKS